MTCLCPVVSWSAMISACSQNEHGKEALHLFEQMQAKGFEPNKVTIICVLDACAGVEALQEGQAIHAAVAGKGWDLDIVVGNALVSMYGKRGNLDDARAVFGDIPQQDVVSWSAMVAACAQNGQGKEALELFGQMQAEGFELDRITFISVVDACACVAALEEGRVIHAAVTGNGWESDVVVGTALVNMYGKCGSLDDAMVVFAEMPQHVMISWSAMMSAFAQNGHGKGALQLLGEMWAKGFQLDKITLICVVDVCASVAALEEGGVIHGTAATNGWESDVVVGNALINMYGKCGCLGDARAVFAKMPQRDVVSWNAMIAACAQNGHGKEALRLFDEMQADGLKPNKITFICVLTACSHTGLVADGRRYFASMNLDHGLIPSAEHYVCMIDILGRRGLLEEAEDLIMSMPFEYLPSAWLSLLSSCRIHSDVERAVHAANFVLELDARNASPLVLLENIHARTRWLEDVVKMKKAKTVIDKSVNKVQGQNCAEINNVVHEPVVRDTLYPSHENLYAMLHV